MPETTREFGFWRYSWTSKKLPSKGSGDRFQNQKERKLFASASQALFRVQEKHQIEHVWVSFHMFWRPTFFIDENCKISEPMHFWTWGFCVHFVPRFDARDSSPEPETPQIFALRPWQFVGWRQAQKNGKKWVSFNASFTPPCQFFRGFRLFRPFLIFIVGHTCPHTPTVSGFWLTVYFRTFPEINTEPF